jgi:hypothetical protein
MIYCAISTFLAIILWFYSSNIQDNILGFIFVISLGIPIIVLFHQILAAFIIREIVEP